MPQQRQPDAGETRAAVALTVVWMLTCMSTAVAMLLGLAFRFLIISFPVAAGGQHPLLAVASVLLLVALITGVLCLVVTPLVYRVRRTPPPLVITVAAGLISVAPIVTLIALNVV